MGIKPFIVVGKIPKMEYCDMIIAPKNGFVNPYFSKNGKNISKTSLQNGKTVL